MSDVSGSTDHTGEHAGIITRDSPFPTVAETVEQLQATTLGRGMTTFAVIDHAANARQASLSLRDMVLLIFGNPRGGTPLLATSPLVGLDLPLRALVWQDDDHVRVSYNATDYLARRFALPDNLIGPIAGIDAVMDAALAGPDGSSTATAPARA